MIFSYKALTKKSEHLKDIWQNDYKNAQKVKNVRFGKKILHLGNFAEIGGKYISYDEIERWFIRVEAANGGEAVFHIYKFVIEYDNKKEYTASLGEYSANLNEKTPVDKIRQICSHHSEIPFGKAKA